MNNILIFLVLSLLSLQAFAYRSKQNTFEIKLASDITASEVLKMLNEKVTTQFYNKKGDFTHDMLTDLFLKTIIDYDNQKIITGVERKRNYSNVSLDFTYLKNGRIKHTELTQQFTLNKSANIVEFKLVNTFNYFMKGAINLYLKAGGSDKIILDTLKCRIIKEGEKLKVNIYTLVYGSPSGKQLEHELDRYRKAIQDSANEFMFPYIRNMY